MTMYFIGGSLALMASVASGDLLDGPTVAVRIVEEDEAGVVEIVPRSRWSRLTSVEDLDVAAVYSALDQLGMRRFDVVDDELQALERARRRTAQPRADGDRAQI